MKIIILGAGRIGESVAGTLVSEQNDITVIDTDAARLRDLESRFELRGVAGNGIEPELLEEAGARDADMLIACAAQDETNLVACKVAEQMFNIPTRIARVRSEAFRGESPLLGREGFAVDRVICPEDSLTRYIARLIDYPEALQVYEFAGGRASLVSVRAVAGAPLVGCRVDEIGAYAAGEAVRVVALYRRREDGPDRFIPAAEGTHVVPGDEVFVLAARQNLRAALAALHRRDPQTPRTVQRVAIAGGGRVGMRLAQQLVQDFPALQLKLIERSAERCQMLAARLPSSVMVLQGDATDEDLMDDESVGESDFFLSLTNDDEDNIMSALLAKRMGARRVLALINRRSYADLIHGTQIDIALTPSQTLLGELLAFVRRGDVQVVHSLRRGVAEAMEIVARGDERTSRVVGRAIKDIKLPRDAHFGLVLRGLPDPDAPLPAEEGEGSSPAAEAAEPEVIVPQPGTVIRSGDHVIIFMPRKRLVREVEKLFRVSATFF
ncbi:Trk system potassium transporter TrkA [Xenophilus sp.]|uniref:Trk system potassium transporter TrkA n=1 Tax=Xenophilus sp. TaxID=1873499 RepID=UPI0037DC4CE8